MFLKATNFPVGGIYSVINAAVIHLTFFSPQAVPS